MMAILSGVPGLEINVQSLEGGVPTDLQEHNDDGGWTFRKFSDVEDAKRSSKYVESKADAEFRIRIVLKHPYQMTSQSLTFKASVDGHGIAQASCTKDYFTRASGFYMELISARLDRINANQITSRPLKFSSIKKVDDADSTRVKEDVKAVAGLGEISVSVFRTMQRDPILPVPANYASPQHTPPTEVAEKALKGKAISHAVTYGDKQVMVRRMKETVDVDGPNNPVGVFVFKYRSREDLQAELIIPRSPSPEAPIPSMDAKNLGNLPAERRARLASLKREIEKIKAEDDNVHPQLCNRGVKRRSAPELISGRAYKTSRTTTGTVVVDLTDE
ncbi:uncharacterized protein PAC_05296 [Phialocephala subalpina]|uniref:DUF7918 domain-containing protein n=1 Tax=Phialocephala subalpina TaxID=576137 RepID=A0A1L7WRN2_9HELO|nr:uncharacterized protein PAC_05296 [Phialocephala subalpina]